jgi:hypothetical protein
LRCVVRLCLWQQAVWEHLQEPFEAALPPHVARARASLIADARGDNAVPLDGQEELALSVLDALGAAALLLVVGVVLAAAAVTEHAVRLQLCNKGRQADRRPPSGMLHMETDRQTKGRQARADRLMDGQAN